MRWFDAPTYPLKLTRRAGNHSAGFENVPSHMRQVVWQLPIS